MRFSRISAACAATSAALALAAPALAHDHHPHHAPQSPPAAPVEQAGRYDGEWNGSWVGPDGRVYQGNWQGTFVGADGREVAVDYSGHWMGNRPAAEGEAHDTRPEWHESHQPPRAAPEMAHRAMGPDQAAREEWLAECRRRTGDNGVGGALIGGVVGGVLGNRIAGRNDRTVGTIAGAAVGAIAGAAIDRAEDSRRVRDECEAYLDAHMQRAPGYGAYGQAYGHPGYGPAYGYAQPMMMVPVMIMPAAPQQPCVETVVTEEYVVAPQRRRHIPRRPAPRRVVPDKRVPIR